MLKKVVHVPLSDREMLDILLIILNAAWVDGKHFCITVICGATGRVMSFPMEGTILISCDRPEAVGIATKKATTLYLTGAESSAEIGDGWLTKPIDPETGVAPHRELSYLGDPAKLTGFEGAYLRHYDTEVNLPSTDLEHTIILRRTVIISCSGDSGHVDAEYAKEGFVGFERARARQA